MILTRIKSNVFLAIFIVFIVMNINIHILNIGKIDVLQCTDESTISFVSRKGEKSILENTTMIKNSSNAEELTCNQIIDLKSTAKQLVAENKVGNRGVSVVNIFYDKKNRSAVLKEAFR